MEDKLKYAWSLSNDVGISTCIGTSINISISALMHVLLLKITWRIDNPSWWASMLKFKKHECWITAAVFLDWKDNQTNI